MFVYFMKKGWIITIIVVVIIAVLAYILLQPKAENTEMTKEQQCVNSGGQAIDMTCYCGGVSDFPANCEIGGCSCNPLGGNAHTIKYCDCGVSKCFNGSSCVVQSEILVT